MFNHFVEVHGVPIELLQFIWLMSVALFGAVVGFITKQHKVLLSGLPKIRLSAFIIGSVVSSLFIAYITFELLMHFAAPTRLSIAIAGMAAYVGNDLLIVLQEAIITKLRDKINKL